MRLKPYVLTVAVIASLVLFLSVMVGRMGCEANAGEDAYRMQELPSDWNDEDPPNNAGLADTMQKSAVRIRARLNL